MSVIRTRAPLRLGLGGGGTDVSPYSADHGGRVLNATVDRYAYSFVERLDGRDEVVFRSPDRQCSGRSTLGNVDELSDEFALHVAVYRRVMNEFNGGRPLPLRLDTQVDAPPGSGLGSSSALIVTMVQSICELLGVSLGLYGLARLSWEIEREDLGLAGGWQDQYAAAFGGFNFMESNDDQVVVNPLRVRREVQAELEACMLLYFGGVSRDSAKVIDEQRELITSGDASALDATHQIRAEAKTMKNALLVGDVPAFVDCIRDGWAAKKKVATGISNPAIERAYDVAAANGMTAGKVSGAGGGGFMMLFVNPTRRLEVTRALESECGGTVANCHFTDVGVESWRLPCGRL